ncbi:MAG: nucleoside triphosphate pyrophosphohydrolase [Chloroflexia bacterium]|nr:nucleoside triphosphate pyrophosphohydrolase [Chloroflexia bacterium]
MRPRITVVGLGPGTPQLLTQEAWQLLQEARQLYLRTARHPVVEHLPAHLQVRALDDCYEQGQDFGQIYQAIVRQLLLASQKEPLLYGVPGHPLVAEATTRLLLQQLGPQQVQIVAGLSFIEPTCTALGLDALEQGLQLYDALDLAAPRSPFELDPALDPTAPLMVAQLYDRLVAAELKLALLEHYPAEHAVSVVRAAGIAGQEHIWTGPLHQLDQEAPPDHLCTLYLPPLQRRQALRETRTLQWLCARLRAPDGCPWDRGQDHASLRNNLLEECYEVLEAIDRADLDDLAEELGDLLLQVFLHAQISREEGAFVLADVVEGINAKLIRRHPHVFGQVTAANSREAHQSWEASKAAERAQAEQSLLDGVPRTLPALAYAQTIGRRVARVGFEWRHLAELWAKVEEELQELRQAGSPEEQAEELGDVLFVLVNLARWLDIEAEDALRATNKKFRRRFAHLEREARRRRVPLESMGIEQLDALWEQAKELERLPDREQEA